MAKYHVELSELQRETERALRNGDSEAINQLDERYIEIWDDILSFTPKNPDETKSHMDFLLEQLVEAVENGGNSNMIRNKILGMCDQQICSRSQNQFRDSTAAFHA